MLTRIGPHLRDVPPSTPKKNDAHGGPSDTNIVSNCRVGLAIGRTSTNGAHEVIGQFRRAMPLALSSTFWRNPSVVTITAVTTALRHHISHVVEVGGCEKMIRTNASLVVTPMTDELALPKRAEVHLIREPMSVHVATCSVEARADQELAVSPDRPLPNPQPARLGFLNMPPKTIFRGLWIPPTHSYPFYQGCNMGYQC
jgi:hypothetical protein